MNGDFSLWRAQEEPSEPARPMERSALRYLVMPLAFLGGRSLSELGTARVSDVPRAIAAGSLIGTTSMFVGVCAAHANMGAEWIGGHSAVAGLLTAIALGALLRLLLRADEVATTRVTLCGVRLIAASVLLLGGLLSSRELPRMIFKDAVAASQAEVSALALRTAQDRQARLNELFRLHAELARATNRLPGGRSALERVTVACEPARAPAKAAAVDALWGDYRNWCRALRAQEIAHVRASEEEAIRTMALRPDCHGADCTQQIAVLTGHIAAWQPWLLVFAAWAMVLAAAGAWWLGPDAIAQQRVLKAMLDCETARQLRRIRLSRSTPQ
jgi:hypothetical protein